MHEPVGGIVREGSLRSAEIRHEICLEPDEFVVVPDHVHGFVVTADPVGAGSTVMVGAGSVGAGSEPAPTGPGQTRTADGQR